MSNEPAPHDAARLDDEYVAYLDGETPPDVNHRLEALLARDDAARADVHSLERVWDALDHLPRAHASTAFTSTTVEMAAVGAEQEAAASGRDAVNDRWRHALLALAVLSAALAAGYAVASHQGRQETEALVKHLPVVERLDEYRQAGNIEFLRQLADEIPFDKTAPTDAKTSH